MQNVFLFIGAVSGCIANVLGAFGAHMLKERLAEQYMNAFNTGVQYQFYHSLALLFLALLLYHIHNKWLILAGIAFTAGLILFPGSLYLFSLTRMTSIAIITPVGGLAFIFGWVLLCLGIITNKI